MKIYYNLYFICYILKKYSTSAASGHIYLILKYLQVDNIKFNHKNLTYVDKQ